MTTERDGLVERLPAVGDGPCFRCGGNNPAIWFVVPSRHWNVVVGGPAATDDPGGLLCPNCFFVLAHTSGLDKVWAFIPEDEKDLAWDERFEHGRKVGREEVANEQDRRGATGRMAAKFLRRAEQAEAKLRAAADALSAAQRVEMPYRRLMWLSHGHRAIYGDDGEMQCSECRPIWDYKRAPLAQVEEAYNNARMALVQAALLSERSPQQEEQTDSSQRYSRPSGPAKPEASSSQPADATKENETC